MERKYTNILFLFLAILQFQACRLGPAAVVIPDNIPPPFTGVPDLLVENYVNRIYIDLLGREAFEEEMERVIEEFRRYHLVEAVRDSILLDIQTNEQFVAGDSSYRWAFIQRIYDQTKIQLLDGVSDDLIRFDIWQLEEKIFEDSIRADVSGQAFAQREILKLSAVLETREDLFERRIEIGEAYRRMVYNEEYDKINQGSYNFVNAVFQDLFFRSPTNEEFYQIFPIVEFNQPGIVFGVACENKEELIKVLTDSREFHEQWIRKGYRSLLAREPSSEEVSEKLNRFYEDRDFQKIMRELMVTNEYANFE
ncbi:MAG: hypothetical protein AAF587_26805 [Bacteroidota bacterium]